ncbi:MAG: hypothetical protein IPM29_07825 [Planctomycetes bacterium]|nr:hypothetical protein [Planctomycetota bacterium]
MRRLVDSILLLLIAYSVSWPLLRGVVAGGDDAAPAHGAVSPPAASAPVGPAPLLIGDGAAPGATLAVDLRWGDNRAWHGIAISDVHGRFTVAVPDLHGEASRGEVDPTLTICALHGGREPTADASAPRSPAGELLFSRVVSLRELPLAISL